MAKLKICNDNETVLYEDGYVNVVDQLINAATPGSSANFQDFIDAEPDERADMLQAFAKVGLPPPAGVPAFVVTQQKLDVPAGQPKQIAIDGTNCKIFAQNDTRVRPGRKKTRITMPFPDAQITDFSYLEPYAAKIAALYSNAATRPKCYKFMFGVMMLTRCR
ncbi:hypothetical protein [Dongia sp. agr-C8]